MNLLYLVLRFLFGPTDTSDPVQPIVVHPDGRTSSGRHLMTDGQQWPSAGWLRLREFFRAVAFGHRRDCEFDAACQRAAKAAKARAWRYRTEVSDTDT